MRRIFRGAVVALAFAALGANSAQAAYTNSIGLNNSTATSIDPGGSVTAGSLLGLPGEEQVNWNNISTGGVRHDAGALIDENGSSAVPAGMVVTYGNIGWILDDIFGNGGKHGNNAANTPTGTLEYIGWGGNQDPDNNGGPMTLTITGIPFASYDVAVLSGWFENNVSWDLIQDGVNEGAVIDHGFGASTATITGSTFSYTGNSGGGGGIYAIQILSNDVVSIPAPSALPAGMMGLTVIGLLRRRK